MSNMGSWSHRERTQENVTQEQEQPVPSNEGKEGGRRKVHIFR